MNKEIFWELIGDSFKEANWDSEKEIEILINKLSKYNKEEILKFAKIYQIYSNESYKSKLWAAAYILNGGCSDDCFDYFRGWLISRGEEPFLNALLDPDSIVDLDLDGSDYYENEDMLSVPVHAYSKSLGSDDLLIDKFYEDFNNHNLDEIEEKEIIDSINFAEDVDMEWNEDDENELRKILPRLYEKFW
ncbi:DUF4240 domain-containing protein [Methanobrevibacter curvatus]|uniref:DUF4240 domain-containing protein n=1 Tax=Methanobrevibacter curvatus TaxID=49547 RepID=A0A166CQU9_9EURY|nr:DUF4240 domain-containing protein [Methanobrevibacter curvatus]KZX16117.1 hypothetical protein MBCUR_01110 [Methanobrevibacter curvatus]